MFLHFVIIGNKLGAHIAIESNRIGIWATYKFQKVIFIREAYHQYIDVYIFI